MDHRASCANRNIASMPHFPLNTDAPALKGLLPEYLECIGCKPRLDPGGLKLKAHCPLHDDTHPSFTAKKKGDVWEWYCHPCKEGGTVVELHARRFKLDKQAEFPRICREVAEIVREAQAKPPVTGQPIEPPTKMPTPSIPNDELASLTLPWRQTLYEDLTLLQKFTNELGLPIGTLYWVAKNGCDGLGIAPTGYKWKTSEGKECTLKEPRLVYIGDGYYKIRAPFGDGREPRFLTFGKAQRPWLSAWLAHDQTTVKDVHLHESETSALALFAAGYWSTDNSSIVVATGGTCGFKPEWVPLFAGRTVHMWPDADEAGQRFAENAAGLLHGSASKVLFHDWKLNTTGP